METDKRTVTVCVISRDQNPRRKVFTFVDAACRYAMNHGISAGYGVAQSGHSVDLARNKAVVGALAIDPKPTHILMVDDDVMIPEDTITALIGCDTDIAGGCYPGLKRVRDGSQNLAPCVLVRREERGWVGRWFEGVVDVQVVPGGCMLIAVEVLEALGFPWFRWPQYMSDDGDEIEHKSDDVDFCDRARALGYKIKAHGGVRCSHFKELDLSLFIANPDREPWVTTWGGLTTIEQRADWPEFGSHVPALKAVGALLNSRAVKVIEYGCGEYSTPVFCNRDDYPHCTSVVSYESNLQWMGKIQDEIPDDRLKMYLTPTARMADSIHPDADVVFIDCDYALDAKGDARWKPRRQLIEAYAKTERPVVLVHDSNFKGIAPAVEGAGYKYRAVYKPKYGPDTAILSNSVDVTNLDLGGVT